MKPSNRITQWLALLALAILNLQLSTAFAQGTAFTYQGRLNNNGSPANGSFDIQFTLYATNMDGSAVAGPVTNSATAVSNGLFTVTVNFGQGVFTGTEYWLDIAVRTNGGGAFTELAPRQALTPAPYAVYSANAGSAETATTAASIPASGIGAGTANISITGNAGTATTAAYAGLAASSTIASTAVTAGTATNLVGNVSDAQLSANIARLNGTNTFTGTNKFANAVIATNANNVIAGVFSGNGAALTNLNSAQFANPVLTNGESGLTLGGAFSGTFTGNGAGLTNLSAAGLSGTITLAQLPPGVVTNNETGVTLGNLTLSGALNLPATTASAGFITLGGASVFHAYGTRNSFVGAGAGNFTMSGSDNTAHGNAALGYNTSGSYNTANGEYALWVNTSGSDNTANGYQALASNTNGWYNTANGACALFYNTSGNNNTANGYQALVCNTTGSDNTANGYEALFYNTSGSNNTANGYQALFSNTNGNYNTADGFEALYNNTSGGGNTANGYAALEVNTSGYWNTADGAGALLCNTSGSNNTACGIEALYNNTSGYCNIALGCVAGYNITGSNNIDIGNQGTGSDNGIIRLGTQGTHLSTYIAGSIQASTNWFMNDKDIHLRSDSFHGVGWYGSTKPFAGVTPDGPVLYGYSGGGLGTVNSTATNLALCWNWSGQVGIGNSNPTNLLVVGNSASPAYCDGTTWHNGSDRNAKADFAAINAQEVLEKVSAMPITQWRYKTEAAGTRHLGPMAQDFHAAFGLNGGDDTHISTVDEGGVALAAIQGLNQKLEETVEQKDAQIQLLRQENQSLAKRLSDLETLVNKLAQAGK